MTLTDRDRKLVLALVPLLILGVFWFLLLSPRRQEATAAADELAKQEERLDAARTAAAAASDAQTGFEADYAQIVRLGKAIPASIDMPSLLVQLDHAAEGTGIRFTRIATGDRQSVPSAPAQSGDSGSDGSGSAQGSESTPAAEAGGESAQSAPGSAVESANEAAADSEEQIDTETSVAANEGGLPVGGGGTSSSGSTTGTGAVAPAGLETVPLELQFVGDFFGLADFFHDVKRFVRVANRNVAVSGRLITIEGFRWTSDPELFPRLQVEMTATIYLSPKSEGTTAGASPSGPDTSTSPIPADDATAPAAAPPSATATP